MNNNTPTPNTMKTIIPFCFASFFAFSLFSQETIHIPDIGLEECLVNLKIDSNGLNGNITISDAEYVTNLNVDNPITNKNLPLVYSKIKDLTGLESFPNLRRLDCFDNEITKIDLSQSSSLSFLNCGENNIQHLDVSGNKNLTYISCDSNALTSLILGKNTSLESLYASYNKLTTLDVSNCPNLKNMDVSGNKITTIIVSKEQLANIPEGWYKDEDTVYTTKNSPLTNVIAATKKTTTTKNELEKYDDDFKQLVVAEYEKNVLNDAYLKRKREELQRKYKLNDKELSKWINELSKLPTTENTLEN